MDFVAKHLEQARVRDAIPERDTAHGDEDDGPEELLEVVLNKNPVSTSHRPEHRARGGHTFLSAPVEKNATMGMIAMTPMSPITSWIECATHQSAMVTMHTNVTHHCLPVKRSRGARTGRMTSSASPVGERAGR